ncbi:hypothetical protein HWV62_30167 [Athelia sp. TMB]|nr:hypothetical protein HWV62_30167 [Athelia sp. TMB]
MVHDPISGLPQISESAILGHARHLSETIGYRTVGTREHALGDAWMVDQAAALKTQCDALVAASPHRALECEVWRQEGNGSHRFDMMGRRLYKTYVGLSNVVVRLSNGTSEGKEHAVLINSHVDSTLPSPGAADDALAVGIMIECIRVLIETPEWSPLHAAVFLFNNAEESLQDGSHLFSTQHEIADTIRAAVNLEAAGTTGREMLFQATSEQMLEAYSHVPRPFGTIVANEVFSSGVIMSDTDFRQFEEYLDVTGLDMAVVGNSYLYHMRKDIVENITPGTAQHMGENALALIQYLTAHPSSLPSLKGAYTRPTSVFFTNLGTFFMYSKETALAMYTSLIIISFGLVRAIGAGAFDWRREAKGVLATALGAGGALVGANVAAFGMEKLLGKSLSWFTNEFSTLALYGPPALTGALISQYLIGPISEHTMFTSLLLFQSILALGVQYLGVGSAGLFFFTAVPLAISLAINALMSAGAKGKKGQVSIWTYALAQISPLMLGSQVMCAVLDVFVPLTGRIGVEAPAEHMIATIVAAVGSFNLPLLLPFTHRFGPRTLRRAILVSLVATAATMTVFAMREPFDEMHQKRLYVLHQEDLQTHEVSLHLASADSAPGLDILMGNLAQEFGAVDEPAHVVVMNENNADWMSLYPFSAFLAPYKITLPLDPNYVASTNSLENIVVTAVNQTIDVEAGTRSFTLQVYHPGVIWVVIAFDAHVVNWELDNNPPDEYTRHLVKEASFYGQDTFSIDMTVKLPTLSSPAGDGILVDYVGVAEKRMWPGKKAEKEAGGRAMVLFEEMDKYVDEHWAGKVDAMLLGCVTGRNTV